MRRRILLDLKVSDEIPGALLEVLCKVSEALEKIQQDGLLKDFGFGLIEPLPIVNLSEEEGAEPPSSSHGLRGALRSERQP